MGLRIRTSSRRVDGVHLTCLVSSDHQFLEDGSLRWMRGRCHSVRWLPDSVVGPRASSPRPSVQRAVNVDRQVAE